MLRAASQMNRCPVAIVGLGRMASTIDDEVVHYLAIQRPYSIVSRVDIRASRQLEAVARFTGSGNGVARGELIEFRWP